MALRRRPEADPLDTRGFVHVQVQYEVTDTKGDVHEVVAWVAKIQDGGTLTFCLNSGEIVKAYAPHAWTMFRRVRDVA